MKIETSILVSTLWAISVASRGHFVTAQQDEHTRTVWRLVQMRPVAVTGDLQLSETRSAIGGSAWGMRGWGQGQAVGAATYPAPAYPGPGFPGAAYPPMSYPAPAAGAVYGQPGNVWGNRGWGQQG